VTARSLVNSLYSMKHCPILTSTHCSPPVSESRFHPSGQSHSAPPGTLRQRPSAQKRFLGLGPRSSSSRHSFTSSHELPSDETLRNTKEDMIANLHSFDFEQPWKSVATSKEIMVVYFCRNAKVYLREQMYSII
jgi:hypothetical protein